MTARAAAAIFAAALVTGCATTQVELPQPSLTDRETIETQLSVDLDGYGNPEIVYVAAKEGSRQLRVAFLFTGSDIRQQETYDLALDPYPLIGAQLSVMDSAAGKVLVFEEFTGGTTAVASTHRFRWDAQLRAMRLIGLDATLYSRTFAHDGREASWNLLTGDYTSHTLKLRNDGGDVAYDEVDQQRIKKPTAPVRFEHSPSGDELLGWPVAGPDR